MNSHVALSDLANSSGLGAWISQLRGRSVLIAAEDQLLAVLAMLELDGTARRIVLCPPDLAQESLAAIAQAGEADAIVSDRHAPDIASPGIDRFNIDAPIVRTPRNRSATCRTEWVLLTSGTTGIPKLVVHDLTTLSAAIHTAGAPQTTWATFYDIRRYGGLQIVLRALLGGTSLVLSNPAEQLGDFLARAGHLRVTHMLGTPTHWRRVLMSGAQDQISPRYVRLSGEIADQSVLDQLRAAYPQAKVVHAFASTEAGVGFEVDDGREGFPMRRVSIEGGFCLLGMHLLAAHIDDPILAANEVVAFTSFLDHVARVDEAIGIGACAARTAQIAGCDSAASALLSLAS